MNRWRGALLWRSAHGGQSIENAAEQLGDQPWVRELDRAGGGVITWLRFGYYADRIRVAPANTDAYRAAAHARYVVHEEIEDAWREVSEGGCPVDPPELPSGRLESFTAGPDPSPSPRFGSTTYVRHPEQPNLWTMATRELRDSERTNIPGSRLDLGQIGPIRLSKTAGVAGYVEDSAIENRAKMP